MKAKRNAGTKLIGRQHGKSDNARHQRRWAKIDKARKKRGD